VGARLRLMEYIVLYSAIHVDSRRLTHQPRRTVECRNSRSGVLTVCGASPSPRACGHDRLAARTNRLIRLVPQAGLSRGRWRLRFVVLRVPRGCKLFQEAACQSARAKIHWKLLAGHSGHRHSEAQFRFRSYTLCPRWSGVGAGLLQPPKAF
jgi:hypothetical protein